MIGRPCDRKEQYVKKIRNLVIGGIENKVFNLILATVFLTAAAFMAGFLYQSGMLADLNEDTNERQLESISEITGNVMDQVVTQSMDQLTDKEAELSDELFGGLKNRVEMLGDYAGKLFSDPDNAPRAAYAQPDPARNGEVTAQLILADGVEEDAIADKIAVAANMSDMMISLFGASAETNSCFVALPEGAFLVTDDRSLSKYNSDGTMVSYDPRTRPWYQMAVEAGKLIFTDVEVDAFTGDIGIVCAMPIYVDGELAAVVGSDLFLTSMQDKVQASEKNGGFYCVINHNGHVVFSPKTEGPFKVLHSAEAADLRASSNTELAALVKDAATKKTDVRLVTMEDGVYYMIGVPMETVGWTMLAAFKQDLAAQPVALLRDNYQIIQDDAALTYLEKFNRSRTTVMVLLLFVTILMLAVALLLGKRIVQPLNNITRQIASLSEENLEFTMRNEYRTGDEIEVLAESFAKLSHKTVLYLDKVKTVTAEKERISTELQMANQIQESMLPSIFPAFPERKEFDIYAVMDPAREVGGDFYDFFLIDEDHLCVVMADVSGKGVPAALFMMISKIILQSCAMLGRSAGEILTKTNEALCSNNKMEMFVTVWLGILEISTGKITAANAGHEYPVVMQNGKFEILKDKHGLVLGGLDGVKYREYDMQLKPGDKLFLYTDGVVEATRNKNELFGMERMLEALNKKADDRPYEILRSVRVAVDHFVGTDEQFDDLTMLCLEYRGPQE